MKASKSNPEVAAIYCPLWHNYDHASSWKGEGWCEWELVKNSKPRFKGHHQPFKPTWGYFDESDPRWSEKEISLAANHGIDVFIVDWYWYSGVKIMEEALERGLLKTKNRNRIKFALMWANHDWADYFPAPFGQKWNSWLPSRHTQIDWNRALDYCIENYFSQPNYWRVDGNLFFSMFDALKPVHQLGGAKSFKRILAATNRKLAKARLPPLHLNAMVGNTDHVDELMAAGYASTTTYNLTFSGKAGPDRIDKYDDIIEAHKLLWSNMAKSALPYLPVVTMGWDVTPRCEANVPWPFPPAPVPTGYGDYPYGDIVVGNTPAKFRKLCEDALDFTRKSNARPNAVVVNAWNEWTESSFLLPEKRYGTAYLKAVHETFKRSKCVTHSGG